MHLSIATSFKEQCLKCDAQLRDVLLPATNKKEVTECGASVIVQPIETDIGKLVGLQTLSL